MPESTETKTLESIESESPESIESESPESVESESPESIESTSPESDVWSPKILAFLCNWCSYAGADLAGTSRMQYPPNVRVIRIMCSGALDPVYVVRALMEGADGVLIGGCHPGDCHYINGNYKARRRVAMLKTILEELGLEKDRFWLRWISASEGQRFAHTIQEIVDTVQSLGPNPLKKEWAV